MTRIERFEDLEAWKLARVLTGLIYDVSGIGEFSRDFALKDQLRRASISIVSNIAEGFERDGDKEFIQFLSMAKGSCGEVRATLPRPRSSLHFSGTICPTLQQSSRIKSHHLWTHSLPQELSVVRKKVQNEHRIKQSST